MIVKFARATQRLAGVLLGGVGVVVQMSNVLICLALIVFGAGATIYYLAPGG
jgi:hypothetical protein